MNKKTIWSEFKTFINSYDNDAIIVRKDLVEHLILHTQYYSGSGSVDLYRLLLTEVGVLK